MEHITVKPAIALPEGPFELDMADLAHVGGGLPKGTWSEVSALPKGTWESALPKGTWEQLLPKGTW